MSKIFIGALLFMMHHSFASEYDAHMPAKVQGTVKKGEWINPHSWIPHDGKKPDGTTKA